MDTSHDDLDGVCPDHVAYHLGAHSIVYVPSPDCTPAVLLNPLPRAFQGREA